MTATVVAVIWAPGAEPTQQAINAASRACVEIPRLTLVFTIEDGSLDLAAIVAPPVAVRAARAHARVPARPVILAGATSPRQRWLTRRSLPRPSPPGSPPSSVAKSSSRRRSTTCARRAGTTCDDDGDDPGVIAEVERLYTADLQPTPAPASILADTGFTLALLWEAEKYAEFQRSLPAWCCDCGAAYKREQWAAQHEVIYTVTPEACSTSSSPAPRASAASARSARRLRDEQRRLPSLRPRVQSHHRAPGRPANLPDPRCHLSKSPVAAPLLGPTSASHANPKRP